MTLLETHCSSKWAFVVIGLGSNLTPDPTTSALSAKNFATNVVLKIFF